MVKTNVVSIYGLQCSSWGSNSYDLDSSLYALLEPTQEIDCGIILLLDPKP